MKKNETNRNIEVLLNLLFMLISPNHFSKLEFETFKSSLKKNQQFFSILKENVMLDRKICLNILKHFNEKENENFMFEFLVEENISIKLMDELSLEFLLSSFNQKTFKSLSETKKLNFFENFILLTKKHFSNFSSELYLNYITILQEIFEEINEEALQKNSKRFQIFLSNNHLHFLIDHLKGSLKFEFISVFCKLVSILFQKFDNHLKLLLTNQIYNEKNFLFILWKEIDTNSLKWGNQHIIDSPFSEMINIFSIFFKQKLLFMDDIEFNKMKEPFDIKQVISISKKLNNLLFKLYWNSNVKNFYLRENLTQLIKIINSRDSRIKFCPKDHWLVEEAENSNFSLLQGSNFISNVDQEEDEEMNVASLVSRWDYFETPSFEDSLKHRMIENSRNKTSYSNEKEEKIKSILKNIPFVVSFTTRLTIFQNFIKKIHEENGDVFIPPVTVRRNFIFEDGYSSLYKLNLKNNINVQFQNESGIGFGVFKEFLVEISKNAFGSNYGLFTFTEDNLIYPNPSSKFYVDNYLNYFEFLGKLLGKAMYEKILVDIPFARFFITKILCKNNLFNDLPFLDPQLYKNLTILKNYDQDVSDLCLNFTISDNYFGKLVENDLIKNGSSIEVTNENRYLYIQKMSNYRLNLQIEKESNAFLKGINQVIPFEWLQLFDENELFFIICGSEQKIDVIDFTKNIQLSGYQSNDITIIHFFEIISEMSNDELKSLLKFITSSSRAPRLYFLCLQLVLGFKDLNPLICIKKTTDNELDRLPTSSTCINLLKLPDYQSKSVLRKKLFQAMEQGTTFELS
jgi:ubiquitin-protein ligase E3 C